MYALLCTALPTLQNRQLLPPPGRDGTAKIGDVGMARILAREYVTGVVGTLAW